MGSSDARYGELLRAGLSDQMCLVWCQIHDVDEVARRFGAEMATRRWAESLDIGDAMQRPVASVLQVASAGEWTLALEPYGFQGVRSAILESLSRGGRAIGVFWNIELDNDVAYAVDGSIVTSFDLMGDLGRRSGTDPGALDETLARVGLHGELPTPQRKERALALGELITGQPLTLQWLRSPMVTFEITDPLPDPLVPSAYLDPRAPFLDEPEFAPILAGPTLEMVPDITRMVVSIVMAAAQPPDDPLTEETLRVLDQGERFPGERESLRARLTEQASEYYQRIGRLRRDPAPDAVQEAERLRRIYPTLVILRSALYPSPLTAAGDAAEDARRSGLLDRSDVMRMTVLCNVIKRIEYDQRHPDN